MTLTFAAFNTESDYDTVQIYNGSTTQTFSGSSIPAPVTATTITVKFTSDRSDTRSGFFAVVTGDVTVTTDVAGKSGVGKCIIE